MPINIPESDKKRVVIVGAGFAGFTLAKKLAKSEYQVVLLDKNNYHQFQPLFYQVAMAGLEPSSISFPLRKAFQSHKNIHIRVAKLESVEPETNQIHTDLGLVNYDFLVLAIGAKTNFFGQSEIRSRSFGLKSVSESLLLRNSIFSDLEKALSTRDYDKRQGYLDIAIVGGGPTGVELAGALVEMKKYILPKEYEELDLSEMDIFLIQAGDRLLKGMSESAGHSAEKYLTSMGVKVLLNTRVTGFDGKYVKTDKGRDIRANKLIWAAGIVCEKILGMEDSCFHHSKRVLVDGNLRALNYNRIFIAGDLAYLEEENYPHGHPQVAQVAIQQARHIAKVLKGKAKKEFRYKDLGTLATVGRNKAVADLPGFEFRGFIAWILWLVVHLRAILGVKNKLFVLINWIWNYITYDQSLRLIIRPKTKVGE